jgi:hypothetical protein
MLRQSDVKERLVYSPNSGLFHWRTRIHGSNHHPGDEAGHLRRHKYYTYQAIQIGKETHLSHRLAWLYMLGEFPNGLVDHINGDTLDNRWINLRPADRSLNAQNQRKASRNNKTGFLGVSMFQGRYRATIRYDGRVNLIGSYGSPEEAHEAYLRVKRVKHKGCTI